ncbi:TPA: DUF262 domain-containing protein [Vibrio parahaemolyticus]|uniref:DUF262 domain-containing protein n=1 Tax=Vibrio parahaemolyticus TaxID=670 RepID=UPI0015C12006|nr:DUF262 domain-containing protein [Vibrio parahaemolyticus]MBE4327521.1 DUF262 domain-containing protein [Vibrio parahaemolyticus]QLE27399.1 DUF262 domain-containing protein [Vibrio parahaemolyticus]HCE1882297.1 DUF262 domain-containing protein [Vibrio parahaemolyticus]HCE3647436.1 DUF262 domain-containing protein [Vibrio parahaemolyticus]HCE4537242.1 DUF262 domain-containing protein [Vibrio parahaemolyticus]
MGDHLSVQTELLTLEKIYTDNYQFSIPSYQRPYVWSDDDVLLLFRDIKEACRLKEPNYFIGTILSSRIEQDGERIYELIDGQQRTTTLMLMTIAFKYAGIKSDLAGLAVYTSNNGEDKPRLQFSIREQVQQLLGGLAGLKNYQVPSKETIADNAYLKQMGVALDVLTKEVEKLKSDDVVSAEAMGDYLYRQVQWVNNIVPTQMDLNRLFATMNTAGIQLEQADILKAKLFKHIHTNKAQYDAMWVACEHLENYFERNVRKVFPTADWYHIEPEHLASFDAERFAAKDETSEALPGLSIAQLASQVKASSIPDNTKQDKFETYDLDVETVYCRPIIKFPLLLIHAYRVYLALNGHNDVAPRLHSDRLLEIFEPLINGDEQSVKLFIETLWQVRYQFDRWVVKWVERDDTTDAQLGLTYQSRSKSNDTYYINRTQKELTDIVLLQSVRNFTGERSAQYWLTPFLSGLIRSSIKQDSEALELLENIDNKMSLSIDTQKEASFALANGLQPNCQSWQSQSTYFEQPLGTSFEHYWFQKLEYLIWKQMKASESSLSSEELNKFKKYRITSKNSVEHVHPQNDEYKSELAYETLNSFGNLVLLSPGENSSYSNQDVDKKRIDFDRKSHFDALKLREMFAVKGQGLWGKQQIDNHLEDMMAIFAQHYKHQ